MDFLSGLIVLLAIIIFGYVGFRLLLIITFWQMIERMKREAKGRPHLERSIERFLNGEPGPWDNL